MSSLNACVGVEMSHRKQGAKIGRGHAVERQDPRGGGLMRVEDVVSLDLPNESALLLTIDGLKDEELKQMMMRSYWEAHVLRKELSEKVVERNEARADKALDAEIKLREKTQNRGFISFLPVFIGFMAAVFFGVSHYSLWAFSIFFIGSAGIYALKKFGDRTPPSGK